jgi:uncharacterized protein YndB with AHSA1/START domain
MNEICTHHDTVVVRRSFSAPVARVFRAWSDGDALARWYVPGDSSWGSRVVAHDFRRGGVKHLVFGPPGEPPWEESCRYEDILPERRLCFSMTILREGTPVTASLVTVEFHARGERTDVVVTDQIAILDGAHTASERERGWGETLGKLVSELAGLGGAASRIPHGSEGA